METIIHNYWTSPHWFGLLPKFLKIPASKNELQDTSWEMMYLPILKTFPQKSSKTQRSTNWFCDLGIDIYNHIHVYNNHIYIYHMTYKHIYIYMVDLGNIQSRFHVTILSPSISQPTLVLPAMLATGELAFQPMPAATMRMSEWSSDWMRFDNLDYCSWWYYVQTLITSTV